MAKFRNCTCIYTDGAQSANGTTGCSLYEPDSGYEKSIRLTDHTTVYASELTAVEHAIEWANNIQSPAKTELVIATDSLAVVQSIDNRTEKTRPNQVNRVLNKIDNSLRKYEKVTITWIPGHHGIHGNEKADELAKKALSRPMIDHHLRKERNELKIDIRKHTTNEWQTHWTNHDRGNFYKDIEPLVGTKVKYTDDSRRKEVTITRLRLGHCLLNDTLHQINRRANDNCDTCPEEETVQHYLMHCPDQQGLREKLRTLCVAKKTLFNLRTILTDPDCVDSVYDWVARSGRKL
jgi:ribonuclease HI